MSFEEFIEVQYLDLFEKTLKQEVDHCIDRSESQRCKFKFLSYLVSKLFEFKNSREGYINISNLIVITLTAFEENYPIDIYSESCYDFEKELNSEYIDILRQEFNH